MKIRGFLIKHRVNSLFRRGYRRTQSPAGYKRLDGSPRGMSNFLKKWGARLKTKAIALCSRNSGLPRNPVLEKDMEPRRAAVPKGKMAVYVGHKDGDYKRVLVPVIYINHPLFGQLLREAEEEYGHDHPGGITIPCRFSDFENVKTRIASVCGVRRMLTWNRS